MTKSVNHRPTRVKCMLSSVERNEMQAFSVRLERVHCGSSWRPVGGVEGRYLKTRRQVAGQMGAAGFIHAGQPGQRVAAAARRQLCPHKAAGEATERPHSRYPERARPEANTWQGWEATFAFFNQSANN